MFRRRSSLFRFAKRNNDYYLILLHCLPQQQRPWSGLVWSGQGVLDKAVFKAIERVPPGQGSAVQQQI
jgi:hypothetical protein